MHFREEWQWLQSLNVDQQVAPPSQTQEEFRKQLSQAAQKLFNILGMLYLLTDMTELVFKRRGKVTKLFVWVNDPKMNEMVFFIFRHIREFCC